jgi:hypothetical protein
MKNCTWKCGRKTKNRTGICDPCWKNRENIYLARKPEEAAAEKKPLSPAKRAALEKLNAKRRNELAKHLPATLLSQPIDVKGAKGQVLAPIIVDCYGHELPVIAPVELENVHTLPPQFT